MEEPELPEASAELRSSVRNTMTRADAQATIRSYTSNMRQMQAFFGSQGRRIFSENLEGDEDLMPLNAEEILIFCEHKRSIKTDIKAGTLSAYKSAALKFRCLNGFDGFSAAEEVEFKRYFKGVGNDNAELIRRGVLKSSESRRHLRFEDYQQLLAASHTSTFITKKSRTELNLAMLLMWNLCARIDTVSTLHIKHFDFEGDSVKVGIAKSKRNYSEVGTYYHLYSNPVNPILCPVLSLAIHCCCNKNILSMEMPLFHVSRSHNNGISTQIIEFISKHFPHFKDIVNHSFRKGTCSQNRSNKGSIILEIRVRSIMRNL
jgi:hypothetical protein